MAEPMFKGGVLREFVQWYEQNHGTERLREVTRALPEDLRSYVDPYDPVVKLLAAWWYPSRFCNLMLEEVADGLTEPEIERMPYDANRWLFARRTSSVYRFALARLVSPELYALSIPRLWRQLHSTRDRTIRVTGTTAESTLANEMPRRHLAPHLVRLPRRRRLRDEGVVEVARYAASRPER